MLSKAVTLKADDIGMAAGSKMFFPTPQLAEKYTPENGYGIQGFVFCSMLVRKSKNKSVEIMALFVLDFGRDFDGFGSHVGREPVTK